MWSKPPKRATDLPNVKGQSNTRVLRSRVEKPAPTVQRKARAARPRDRNGDPKFANLGGDKQRPNVGSGKHLEKFWHVERRAGETLPPRGCLWREKRTNENLITYTLVHAKLTGYVPISPDSPQENYPHLSRLIIPPAKGASSGMKEFYEMIRPELDDGLPVLRSYEAKTRGHTERWLPYSLVGAGSFGVVVSYVNEKYYENTDDDDEARVPDELLRVVKYNYKGSELKLILKLSAEYMQRRAKLLREGRSEPSDFHTLSNPVNAIFKTRLLETEMYRQEHRIMELLHMTGSCHFTTLWGVAHNKSRHGPDQKRPRQDITMIPLEYIPGGRILRKEMIGKNIDFYWETMFCLSKALSAMAYGSEDPAPSHRIDGWCEIVHMDMHPENIFVQNDVPGHSCGSGDCIKLGDFGRAIIVPSDPKDREDQRRTELNDPYWSSIFAQADVGDGWSWIPPMCPPESRWPRNKKTIKNPYESFRDDSVFARFTYKTNVWNLGDLYNSCIAGAAGTLEDDLYRHTLTDEEEALLATDPMDYVPMALRPTTTQGYLPAAHYLMKKGVFCSRRVSERRFRDLIIRCLEPDPAKRPEIEEIMMQAARGIAEARGTGPHAALEVVEEHSGSKIKINLLFADDLDLEGSGHAGPESWKPEMSLGITAMG